MREGEELMQLVRSTATSLEHVEDVGAWLADQLEVVGLLRHSYGNDERPVLHAVEVLVTYGGPTIRVTFHDGGEVEVTGGWGSDTARTVLRLDTMAEEVLTWCEEVTA